MLTPPPATPVNPNSTVAIEAIIKRCIQNFCEFYNDCSIEADNQIETGFGQEALMQSSFMVKCFQNTIEALIIHEVHRRGENFMFGKLSFEDAWIGISCVSAFGVLCFLCSFKCRIPRTRLEIDEDYQARQEQRKKYSVGGYMKISCERENF